MWAIGCVFAQLCSSTQIESIFRGNYQIELLFSIFSILGTPTNEIWPLFPKQIYYQVEFPRWNRKTDQLYELTKLNGANGLDFLKTLFTYDPKQRPTAQMALEHSFFHR